MNRELINTAAPHAHTHTHTRAAQHILFFRYFLLQNGSLNICYLFFVLKAPNETHLFNLPPGGGRCSNTYFWSVTRYEPATTHYISSSSSSSLVDKNGYISTGLL